jgi:hypothetical protein
VTLLDALRHDEILRWPALWIAIRVGQGLLAPHRLVSAGQEVHPRELVTAIAILFRPGSKLIFEGVVQFSRELPSQVDTVFAHHSYQVSK